MLFLVAQGFFGSVIENWFSLRVQSAMRGSAQVASRYYQEEGDDALYFADRLAREIEQRGLLSSAWQADLARFVEEQRAALNVGGIDVISPAGPLASARSGELARLGDAGGGARPAQQSRQRPGIRPHLARRTR